MTTANQPLPPAMSVVLASTLTCRAWARYGRSAALGATAWNVAVPRSTARQVVSSHGSGVTAGPSVPDGGWVTWPTGYVPASVGLAIEPGGVPAGGMIWSAVNSNSAIQGELAGTPEASVRSHGRTRWLSTTCGRFWPKNPEALAGGKAACTAPAGSVNRGASTRKFADAVNVCGSVGGVGGSASASGSR